jgi:predicted nucleic acid-binding protein
VAVYFFDSSAVVKRCIRETGSLWVAGIVHPATGNPIHVAYLTGVEVVSAITRRKRSGSLSAAAAVGVLAQFRQHFANEYKLVDMTPTLVDSAMALAEKHGLRAYDAVQLAAALVLNAQCLRVGTALTLVSADIPLNAAAVAEGLTTDDPNAHP